MQSTLFATPPEHDQERAREYDFDATPRGVVREICEYLARVVYPHSDRERLRILDPSAGAGVYGSELRRVFPKAEVHAVEPRREEYENLREHYYAIDIMTFAEYAGLWRRNGERPFDLIVSNPPFSHFEEFIEDAHDLAHPDGCCICFLGLTQWGQAAGSADLFKRRRPWRQLRIGGRVGFRGSKGQTDSREYSHWLWRVLPEGEQNLADGFDMRFTEMYQLPPLPAEARRWRQRPGAETPAELARLDAVLEGVGR